MMSVNMFEAKSDLSRLVKMLENKEEDVIYIARNGTRVAQLTLAPKEDISKRIGIAKDVLVLSEGFDEWFDSMDKEIEDMFEEHL